MPRSKRKLHSPAAKAARERNFTIHRLRGMWAAFGNLSVNGQPVFLTNEAREGQEIIDHALDALGAERESMRRNKFVLQRETLK